jgi:hypothetical protein
MALPVLAGCGGSSSSALSRSELTAKVDGFCTAYHKAVAAISQPTDFFQNPVDAAAYLDKLKPLVHTEFNDIAALTPPGDVKADFETLVADGRHQLGLFDDADAKAHAKDPSGIKDVQDAAAYKRNVLDPLQSKLGFTACVS